MFSKYAAYFSSAIRIIWSHLDMQNSLMPRNYDEEKKLTVGYEFLEPEHVIFQLCLLYSQKPSMGTLFFGT